jgi:uncharacterized protein involved in exopolysaccharide biosynthesis
MTQQNTSGTPDPRVMENAIAALRQQRNAAMDQIAALQGRLSVVEQDLVAAKAELAKFKSKPNELSK